MPKIKKKRKDSSMTARISLPKCQIDYEEPWNHLHIDLRALQNNYKLLRSRIPGGSPLFVLLKSDAYGHGLVEVGKALSRAGCRHFAVETPQEGILMRKDDIPGEILLLNPIPLWMASTAVHHDLTVSVIHHSILYPLNEAARLSNKRCRIHLNVNVGLHRMGIPPSRFKKLVQESIEKDRLELTGLFAQPRDNVTAPESFRRLQELVRELEEAGLTLPMVHFANSTTFLSHPELAQSGVRLGILVYGILPPENAEHGHPSLPLKPVMELTTEVVQLRELSKGSVIGYRAREKTKRDTKIATLPLGYAHGLDRKLEKGGYVLLHGCRAPFIGAISMNSSTIDGTDIENVKIGDRITVIGRQKEEVITVNELANISGTIAAELMVRMGRGIARKYVKGEKRTLRRRVALKSEGVEDIRILKIQSDEDMPEGYDAASFTRFLQDNSALRNDTYEMLYEAVSYAISMDPRGEGFLVLAQSGAGILGLAVCVKVFTPGAMPETLLAYFCVHGKHRGKGIGTLLMKEVKNHVEGDLRINIPPVDPSMKFFEKNGFYGCSLEMRCKKGAGKWMKLKPNLNKIERPGTAAP